MSCKIIIATCRRKISKALLSKGVVFPVLLAVSFLYVVIFNYVTRVVLVLQPTFNTVLSVNLTSVYSWNQVQPSLSSLSPGILNYIIIVAYLEYMMACDRKKDMDSTYSLVQI